MFLFHFKFGGQGKKNLSSKKFCLFTFITSFILNLY